MPFSNDVTTSDVSLRHRSNGVPKKKDVTSSQLAIASFGLTQPELPKDLPTSDWYTLVRAMRTDPTLSLLRDLVMGPIIASEWSVGHTDEAPSGATELVRKQMNNMRTYLVEHTLTGYMDYGWQAFEKIWTIDNNGNAVLDKVKPLLHEITRLLVSTGNGEYLGLVQTPYGEKVSETRIVDGEPVFGTGFLKAKESVLCNINVEGTYWYGRPIMQSAVLPYTGWITVNNSADRYDSKIAGSHWIVHYPLGVSELEGIEVDNFLIAKQLMQGLESSGAVAIPRRISEIMGDLNDGKVERAWEIELLSDQSSQQGSFIERLSYYDKLKARALGFPERAIQEGTHGTKSESESHGDFAISIAEYRHTKLTEQLSVQIVNDILRFNYGADAIGTVFLRPAPIADDTRNYLKQLFQVILQNDPQAALEMIDRDEMQEKLRLPRLNDANDDSKFNFREHKKEEKKSNHNLNPEDGQKTTDPLEFPK